MKQIIFISQENLFIKMLKSYFQSHDILLDAFEKIDKTIYQYTNIILDLPSIELESEEENILNQLKNNGAEIFFFKDEFDSEKNIHAEKYGEIYERDLRFLDEIFDKLIEKKSSDIKKEEIIENDHIESIKKDQNHEKDVSDPNEIIIENNEKKLEAEEDKDKPIPKTKLNSNKDNFSIDEDVKILIADDSNAIRNFVRKILISKGYQVEPFEDGKQLIDYLEAGNSGDLILLDNQMPNMNGIDTLQYLKEKKEFRDYPVLFLSAIKEKDTVVEALEFGADDYMEKPFHNNEFLARINVHVRMELLKRSIIEKNKVIEQEKEKSDQLLLNTLPKKIVEDLKTDGKTYPETFENVTVYFSDIAGFTSQSSKLEPGTLINELNEVFTEFDNIMEGNFCERIKTIGDAYLAVCGMPMPNENHAENMMKSAVEIIDYLKKRNEKNDIKWKIRIGIHSGKVTGGIVGVKKYIYDVFGDTINTASRMESNSLPMEINVSPVTYDLLKDKYDFVERDPIEVKGKGRMKMYFLNSSTLKDVYIKEKKDIVETKIDLKNTKNTDRKSESENKNRSLREVARTHMSEKVYSDLYNYYKKEDCDSAEKIMKNYINEDLDAKHYKLFGLIYYACKEYPKTIKFWKKSLEINPDQEDLKNNLDTLNQYINQKAFVDQ